MKSKTLILMVVAIGCGLAASYMTSRVIADRNSKEGDDEKISVLVAKHNLTLGHMVKEPEKDFEFKAFTKGEEPKKALRDLEQVKDKVLNKPITAEQFVTLDDLNDRSQAGLPAVMQKGMRAWSLKVSSDTTSGGFVLPNTHVDVVCVVRAREGETWSKTILQNVLVLAVDTMNQRPDDKQAVISSTVTLEVTPAQAEKLSLATEMGTLRLVLRAFGDEEKIATSPVRPKDILHSNDSKPGEDAEVADNDLPSSKRPSVWGTKVPDVPAPPPPAAEVKAPEPTPPPAPKTFVMTIFNGPTMSRAIFTQSDEQASVRVEESPTEPAPAAKTTPRPAPAKR